MMRTLFTRGAVLAVLALVAASDTPAQSIRSVPDSVTLQVGDTVRLAPVVRNGAGAPIAGAALTFSGTNATAFGITSAGLITARAPGCGAVRVSYRPVTDHTRAQVPVCIVARVTPPPVTPPAAPWFRVDPDVYTSTADWLSRRTGGSAGAGARAGDDGWGAYETNTKCNGLGSRAELAPGGYLGRRHYFRYVFDGLAACSLSEQQANYGVHFDLQPAGLPDRSHLFVEVPLRFDAGWRTGVYGGPNAPDHKTCLLFTTAGDRWEVKIGAWGTVVYVGDPINGQGLDPNRYTTRGGPSHAAVASATYWRGDWFRLRMEVATGPRAPFRVWLENPAAPGSFWLIHDDTIANVPRQPQTLRCGSNLNSGMPQTVGFGVGYVQIDTLPFRTP